MSTLAGFASHREDQPIATKAPALSCEHDAHCYREMGFRNGPAEAGDPT